MYRYSLSVPTKPTRCSHLTRFKKHFSSVAPASVQVPNVACWQSARSHLLLWADQLEGFRRPHGVCEGDVGRHGGAHEALAGAAYAVDGAAGRPPANSRRALVP